ncbi:hypothetical protein [Paenibacillus humicus]|uniref:hypothetical protein n=1 Tax=Paenibacillus humicus TaxID=412861 RepID=UPI003D28055A
MSNKLNEIVDQLREMYPEAASVELFVNSQEHNIEVRYVNTEKAGYSMKSLNGKWIGKAVSHE